MLNVWLLTVSKLWLLLLLWWCATDSPHIHQHHGSDPEDRVEHQLQKSRSSPRRTRRFSGGDPLQHQVVDSVSVPQGHVTQNLRGARCDSWSSSSDSGSTHLPAQLAPSDPDSTANGETQAEF